MSSQTKVGATVQGSGHRAVAHRRKSAPDDRERKAKALAALERADEARRAWQARNSEAACAADGGKCDA